jgi:OPT family oligopeptide transporter
MDLRYTLPSYRYYTNVWHFAYFPISSGLPYDRNGEIYNVTRVLTPEVTLDLHKYQDYSPLYLPANYAMTYLIAFAMSTCILVHTALHHGRSILNQVKKVKMEADDIHAKLMRNYPEVPDWWYGAVFFFFFLMGIVLVEVWHTNIPVWILILSLLLPIIYILPGGLILAMTGQPVGINILAQIIPGAIVPGSPLVNMLFKTYAIQTLVEAEEFVQDLKLGHYIKVPPRATFIVQLAATTIAATVQIGVKTWLFASVDDICTPNQRSHLTCPHNEVFFTASAVW